MPKFALVLITDNGMSEVRRLEDTGRTLRDPIRNEEFTKLGKPTSHKLSGWRRFLGRRDLHHVTAQGAVSYTPPRLENTVALPADVEAILQTEHEVTPALNYAIMDSTHVIDAVKAKKRDWFMFLAGAAIGGFVFLILGAIITHIATRAMLYGAAGG